jgi:hypothetical protein
MKNKQEITFTGAGCNDSGLFRAVRKANDWPSRKTLPAGATWPFVKLSISEDSVEFSMAHIRKVATPKHSVVSLGKLGYVYFHTQKQDNDFGFYTLRLNTLIKELRKRGYRLDDSFRSNMRTARVSQFIEASLPVVFLIIMICVP